ncbi:MAG: sulfatase-like hydrolase/transferase, partial [Armatimonadota bacterium]
KYAVFAPEKNGWEHSHSTVYVERYLYDLAADPHEQVNLVGRSDYRSVADELRDRLLARMEAAGETRAEIQPARYPA